MFKRYQVLLTDWLGEYIKYTAEKYDLSFSEVIRILLCLYICELISEFHPRYKFPKERKELINIFKKVANKKISEEDIHKLISQAYFEARKAIEYRLAQDKKNSKKNTR